MLPKLYGFDESPPTRAVLLTVKTLGISIDYHKIDYFKEEHKTPEFIKMNPQHTVPTLVDEGCVIWDSHAIMAYLVDKYGSDDTLYPKDLVARAIINQRLHFESGCIFSLIRNIVVGIRETKSIKPEYVKVADEQYQFLNLFLEGKDWMAGNTVTIADFSLISSVTSLTTMIPQNPLYKNLASWIERCEKLPHMEINKMGLKELDAFVTKMFST